MVLYVAYESAKDHWFFWRHRKERQRDIAKLRLRGLIITLLNNK